MVMRENRWERPSDTTSESILNPRRAKTWQMRMRTPALLFTKTESVWEPWPWAGSTGVSVVTMVLTGNFRVEDSSFRWGDHVDPVGLAILYFGGSVSMSSRAAPAGIMGNTLSVLTHSA